ncbi:MAG TPA: GH92 family glycosyl hydrolase [Gammaproteobacteria bacterium]|nr:GH92 family glycosyl hydrolase [Gammaproteobacteria bacterium]
MPFFRLNHAGAIGTLSLVATAILAVSSVASATPEPPAMPEPVGDPAAYVNPFIGTGRGGEVVGEINNFPGPSAPFGMIQWSPDTKDSYAGYQYHDGRIRGFSLTHASVGCSAFGDIAILPFSGAIGDKPWQHTSGYTHDKEQASPGYYAVTLGKAPVHVELTATTRTGLGRFTFPHTRDAQVLIKAASSFAGNTMARVRIVGDDTVVGSASTGHFCGAGNEYTLYFVVKFDRPFTAYGVWQDGEVKAHERHAKAASDKQQDNLTAGAYLTFDTRKHQAVRARVALSYVSIDGAKKNMKREIPGWDFDSVRDETRSRWNDVLSRIEIGGGTPEQRQMFYTALYHSLLYPTTFSDVDGRYIGFDNKIHTLHQGQRVQYANFSAWDTYRSLAALHGWLYPAVSNDLAQSLVNDAEQGGWLPVWPMANGYTGVMNGDNTVPLIASLYAFGAHGFDAPAALHYMVKGATQTKRIRWGYVERQGIEFYQKLGYVPNDKAASGHTHYGASETLEYAIDDFAISQLAAAVGQDDIAHRFARRAQHWRNIFDPATRYLRPRHSDGKFPPGPAFVPPPPGQFGQDGFDEGNAAQYNWLVPQNMCGLAAAMGGRKAAAGRADRFFRKLNVGPNEPYEWAGNEPDFAAPWIYDYFGEPWKTQALVRRIQTRLYSAGPDGEPGNDDLGAQSSWYVWAALGLYPATPGTDVLALDSPLFPYIRIHLPGGGAVVSEAPRAAEARPYVHELRLDGRILNRTYLRANALRGGAKLQYVLSSQPDIDRATGADAAPPCWSDGNAG